MQIPRLLMYCFDIPHCINTQIYIWIIATLNDFIFRQTAHFKQCALDLCCRDTDITETAFIINLLLLHNQIKVFFI